MFRLLRKRGVNAMIVDSSALIEQVVDDVVSSAFQSAGQRCSALRILFIQAIFMNQLLRCCGKPWKTSTWEILNGFQRMLALSLMEGHGMRSKPILRITPPLARTPLPKIKGTFVAPTLIEVKGMEDVRREVFGPVLHVARFKAQNLEKVVRSINQSGYGLTMGVQSRIERTINQVRELGACWESLRES